MGEQEPNAASLIAFSEPIVRYYVERTLVARHPSMAARFLADLYSFLTPLRQQDAFFLEEWSRVMDGRFLEGARDHETSSTYSWRAIWAATDALLDLMDRQGVPFPFRLPFPDEGETTAPLSATCDSPWGDAA